MLSCNIGNYLIKRQRERYIITTIIILKAKNKLVVQSIKIKKEAKNVMF